MGRLKSSANSRQRRFDFVLIRRCAHTARAGAVDWSILWFDPRPRAFFRPDHQLSQPPRAGPVKAGRVFRGHPKGGLGLDWPEHGGILDRIGAAGVHYMAGQFNPRWL